MPRKGKSIPEPNQGADSRVRPHRAHPNEVERAFEPLAFRVHEVAPVAACEEKDRFLAGD